MRESTFIKKNLQRWKRYQEQPAEDPDELAERFTSLLDDLAYAKTFYSFSKITAYINSLAAGIYHTIYGNRKEQDGRFRNFFVYELPLLFRRYHRLFLFSFLFFLLFCVISAFSAAHDETFVRGVLGDEYVGMTEQNINNGDPFGVYKQENELVMFLRIAERNITVAMLTFVSGLTLGVGTLWLMMKNAVMLGAFQYYFFSKGLGLKSILVIWIHGTLEISAIVIAGCAGLVMVSGLIFPGTRKRLDALKNTARDGVKIVVTLIPIFIVAAFLEGFVTRHTAMPVWTSVSILSLSLLFIVSYFIVYPIYLHRKGYKLGPKATIIKPVK
ncbi:stage II sporulation protein M [Chitinophaga ginsengisoli]|uniref:Putative membrane protein SpoIIM required for sporulation n=1 Tax=Chitinophaga ginsengisoli TaxID=363837 RepID=A0A2P8G6T5_9BACT|nr:stage II sporulation protein M [Chitinophaga ginsengisoli]PSL29684.1 putative membrane protein SpoIIM required for sporulation [Chitinophaga ginsengisoli]